MIKTIKFTFKILLWYILFHYFTGCPIIYYVLQYRMLSDSFENEWILVSNALKPQRRFTLAGLLPSTVYQLRMEAHNVAGSSSADFNFITLTKDGGMP